VTAPTSPRDPPGTRPPIDGGECPGCGAPLEPLQEYCLHCGNRVPTPGGVVAALGGAWRRRLRWYPGDWIWVALALLAIAAIGAAVAVATSRENSEAGTIVATTSPGVITGPAVQTTPETAPTATPEPPPTATAKPPAPQAPASSRRQRKLRIWPSGKSGWTIVLRSDTSRERARAEARKAIRAGLRDVGVLDSASYSSLHPGYFVVFSGIYDSQPDAEDALDDATSGGYPGAYVRPVSP